MKTMALATAALLALMAVPADAGTQTYECDVLVGIGVVVINPDALLQNGFPGIGGCFLGEMEQSGTVDTLDIPAGCSAGYDADQDGISEGTLEGSVEAGWNVWVFCDAGVVGAHATLIITQ